MTDQRISPEELNAMLADLSIPEKDEDSRADVSGYRGVWIFCEQRRGRLLDVGLELLGKGRELADDLGSPLTAVLFGSGVEDLAGELLGYGPDEVLVCDDPALAEFTDDGYGALLADLIEERRPEIVLCGATALGRSFIPGRRRRSGPG